MQIQWTEFNSDRVGTKSKGSLSKNKKRQASLRGKRLSQLLHTTFKDLALEARGNKNAKPSSELQDIEVASGDTVIDLQKQLDEDRLLPQIWRRIRTFAAYRPEHIRERIEGLVHVRVRIGKKGELLRLTEETMTGPKELQGWVILFLIEALRTPFLSEGLRSAKTLDLRFYFSVNQLLPPPQVSSARMVFPIDGSLPAHIRLAQNAKDLFADGRLKNAQAWSYYEQRKVYEEACEIRKNAIACEKVLHMKRMIGQ